MTSLGLCLSLLFVGALGAQYPVPELKHPEARQDGGFQLFFGTNAPTPALPGGSGGFDPNCVDKMNNCPAFGKSACQGDYVAWAKDNCPNYCGFCQGPTTPAPECKDKIENCDAYGVTVCNDNTYKSWALDNCRYFCSHHAQGFCSDAARQLQDSLTTTTTIAPENCVDKVDCRLYEPQTCSETYKSWAKENCMNYCNYCTGKPTPPQPCIDRINNCNMYDRSTCTDSKYRIWAEDNCPKTCGICGGGSLPATNSPPMQPMMTSGPGTLAPPFPGKRSEDLNGEMTPTSTEAPPTMSTSTESPPAAQEKPIAAAGGQPIEGTPPPRLTTTTSTEAPPTTTPLPTTTSTELPPSTTTSTELPPSTPSTTELPPSTVTSTEKPGEPLTTEGVPTPRVTTQEPQPVNTTEGVVGIPTTPESVVTTDNGVPQPVVTTEAPAVSTQGPAVVTSQMPEATTEAAQTTMGVPTPRPSTQAPEMTTQGPVETTPAPATSAAVPEVTTQQPVVVGVTTDVVGIPTTAPPATTEAAGTTVEVPTPKATTEAPSETTIAVTTMNVPTPKPSTDGPSETTAHGHQGHGHQSTTEDACVDKIPNCRSYEKEKICVPSSPYYAWATVRCRRYCRIGQECEGLTTPYVPCVDKNPNCAQYNDDLCTNPAFRVFREDNCRAFCGLCTTISTMPTSPMSTTRDPIAVFLEKNCTDILSDCNYYSDESCFGIYEGWARRNCALRCGYCPGKSIPCEDTDPLCPQYGDNFCRVYEGFSRTNCRKYCNYCYVPTPNTLTNSSAPVSGGTNPTPNAPNQNGSTPGVIITTTGVDEVPTPRVTTESTDNQTADSLVPVKIFNGPPSDRTGFCTYTHDNQTEYIAANATYKDGCRFTCECDDVDANKVVCTAVCPQWIRYPSSCRLVKIPDECCEELQCPDGVLPATSRPMSGNP